MLQWLFNDEMSDQIKICNKKKKRFYERRGLKKSKQAEYLSYDKTMFKRLR